MPKRDPVPIAPDCLARLCPSTCLLCGQPAAYACVYVPGAKSPIALPTPLIRMIPYSMCERCGRRRMRLLAAVEAAIEQAVLSKAASSASTSGKPH